MKSYFHEKDEVFVSNVELKQMAEFYNEARSRL